MSKFNQNLIQVAHEQPFVCKICNIEFKQEDHLNQHLRFHIENKPSLFEVPGSGLKELSTSNQDLTQLPGGQPFVCKICLMGFSDKDYLSHHLEVHNVGKPFVCVICAKGFDCRYSFNRHLRVHTGEKPFVCDICKKGFTRRYNFNKHLCMHDADSAEGKDMNSAV